VSYVDESPSDTLQLHALLTWVSSCLSSVLHGRGAKRGPETYLFTSANTALCDGQPERLIERRPISLDDAREQIRHGVKRRQGVNHLDLR